MIRCECCSIDYPCGIHGSDLHRQQIRRSHNWPIGLTMGCKLCEHRCKNPAIVVSGRSYCLTHAQEKFFPSLMGKENDDMLSIAKIFEKREKKISSSQVDGEKILLEKADGDK